MPLPRGIHFDPYEIAAPQGVGGIGEVYRARDRRLERTVAIKILPAQFSSDSVRSQRFGGNRLSELLPDLWLASRRSARQKRRAHLGEGKHILI